MRVTLARPYGDHAPDETVDLPDAEARRLIGDGKARIPVKPVKRSKKARPRPVRRSADSGYRGPKPPSDSAFAGPKQPDPNANKGDPS